MLNYDFMIGAYEQILSRSGNDEGKISCVGEKLAAFRLLNGRTEDEVYALFDTGAFNEIVYAYVKSAIGNAGLPEHSALILDELRFLFGVVGAKQLCEARKNADN